MPFESFFSAIEIPNLFDLKIGCPHINPRHAAFDLIPLVVQEPRRLLKGHLRLADPERREVQPPLGMLVLVTFAIRTAHQETAFRHELEPVTRHTVLDCHGQAARRIGIHAYGPEAGRRRADCAGGRRRW